MSSRPTSIESQTCRLAQVLRRHNKIIHPGDRSEGTSVFVGLEHVESHTGRRIGSALVDFAQMSGRKPTFRAGQIVYGYLRPYLNKVWIAEFDGCSSVDQFAFDVNQELADTAFLASFMRSETFLRRAAGSTTTGQLPRISIDEILAVECELPPITQQKEIAADLAFKSSAVQAANHAARERLVAAETLASAFYREAFGEAVPFTASPIVPSEPVCVGWSWHRLTDVARLATGHTPSRRCPEYWDGDIPWIQLPDIRALDGKIALDTSEHTNEAGIANSAAVLLPKDTVCMSRTASVGFVTMMGKPMATSQDFVNWVCGPDLDAAFLMHLLIRCRSAIRELGSGAVHHTIYFPTVESFAVCIPPVIEQRRIVELLTANLHKSFDLASRCREELAAIEALPASLLRTVFERNGVDG